MKNFKGKAIRNPSGKAGEYSYWACDFFKGCSVGCVYCFNKKGRSAKVLGGDKPELKDCFKNEQHALSVFQKEVLKNIDPLQKHGLFFSFNTDIMLPEVKRLSFAAIQFAIDRNIPIKILSKIADFDPKELALMCHYKRNMIAIGFTLTGHDELEPGASTNAERIVAMRKLHEAGFKTFASIEPIIDFESSLHMLWSVRNFCDLAKIGLESGKKYDKSSLKDFINKALYWANGDRMCAEILQFKGFKVYFKDSLLRKVGINREDLPGNCVQRDFNIFKN